MRLAELDYALPSELIAQAPARERTDARLLVVERHGSEVAHAHVRDLPGLLAAGDLLVLNDTRVIAARVRGRRPSGGRIEMLLCEPLGPGVWLVLAKGSPRVGERVHLPGGEGEWVADRGGGQWHLRLDVGGDVLAWLESVGEVPLPPYIRRPHGPSADDRARYQTVFARCPGAVAAPTAGLHFTPALLQALVDRGVRHTFVTLHVGLGTFLPVRDEALDAYRMRPERFEIAASAVEAIAATRAAGGRVIAVGTTTVRTLESAAARGPLRAARGEADLFIAPGHAFRVVDGMVTNFHLPRTPLLALVSALTGWERIRAAYEEAVRARYRFYSYGDAMLIL